MTREKIAAESPEARKRRIARAREYNREYRQRTEAKAKQQKRRQTPKLRERERALERARRKKPESKMKAAAYARRPERLKIGRERIREKRLNPDYKALEQSRAHTPNGRYAHMKHGAAFKKIGGVSMPLSCSISREEYFSILPANGAPCPICRNAMWSGTKYTPSNDRRDNSKGYESGNVAIICRRCNTIKSEASATLLTRIAMYAQGLL